MSKYERNRRMAGSASSGPSAASGGKWQGETEADNLRAVSSRGSSYRDPDKLKDKEEYSDQEEEVEIVDLDDVGELDAMAPRALPRMQDVEKKKKQERKKQVKKKEKEEQREKAKELASSSSSSAMDVDPPAAGTASPQVKADPEDVEAANRAALQNGKTEQDESKKATTISPDDSDASDVDSDDDRPKDGKVVDALDLSESEEEETMDDLVDDFVFDDENLDTDHGGVDPSNRLYLFQFPQLFPRFKVSKDQRRRQAAAAASAATAKTEPPHPAAKMASSPPPKSALSTSPPGSKGRRSVAFAEGTVGGGGAPSSSTSVKREHDEDAAGKPPASTAKPRPGPEGRVGSLKVYRDGRVEMHFTRKDPAQPLVMELTGGSQTSFLQDLAVLDPVKREAYILGEIQRKFVCSPGVEGMLDDAMRLGEKRERVKREGGRGGDDDDDDDDDSSDGDDEARQGGDVKMVK